MLFFAVSSAGSCSPTSLPGFRHPGFRLSFRSSLLSGSLPSSRLSLLLFLSLPLSLFSFRPVRSSSRHSSRGSPFSPVLSPLGSLPSWLSLKSSLPSSRLSLLLLLSPSRSSPPGLSSPSGPYAPPPGSSSSLSGPSSFSSLFQPPPAYSRSRSEPPALRSRSSSRSARLSRIESRIVQRLSNSWASMRGCSSLTTRMMSFIAT